MNLGKKKIKKIERFSVSSYVTAKDVWCVECFDEDDEVFYINPQSKLKAIDEAISILTAWREEVKDASHAEV